MRAGWHSVICALLYSHSPLKKDKKMVGFAVVGLGMGRNRSRQVVETAGAELKVVVDINESLARDVGEEMGCD